MWVHRLFYVLILAVSALFFVLYPHWLAWYIVVLILLILPFDLLLSLPGMLTRRVSLRAPHVLGQGENGMTVITNISEGPLPSGALRLSVRVSHEDKTVYRRLACPGARGSQASLVIDTSRSGITVTRLRRLRSTSLLGLFSIPLRVQRVADAAVLVLPAPVKPSRSVSLPRTMILRAKPGGGFAENHDIRPYRIGDPVNSVHWKLSAKHDSLMIREPLSPPPHSRLVSAAEWSGADERDLILGRLLWVSDWLLGRGLSYYIKLEGRGAATEITAPDELPAFLYNVLNGTDTPAPASLPPRFTWVFKVDAKREVAR